jgi:endonuclease-8
MPEGDSIKLLATRLARVLVGKEVRKVITQALAADSLVGRTIVGVDARGKNLLVRFDDGRALHIHLRMLGRVRIDTRATYTRFTPQIRLEVDGAVVTGRRIPVLRILSSTNAEKRAIDIGPDLLAEDFDEAEAIRRLRKLGAKEIGEALLAQHALHRARRSEDARA